MLLRSLVLVLGLVSSRAEIAKKTLPPKISSPGGENKASEASENPESIIPRSGVASDPKDEKNVFKTKEAESIVTDKEVEISGGKLSPEEKKARVEELVQEMVDLISDDIVVANQALAEKGSVLSDKEAEEFFQTVAENTMYRIKDSTVALKELVVDNDEVSKLVAERVAVKAAALGVEKVMNNENDVDRSPINENVAEITKSAEEFLKFALQSA